MSFKAARIPAAKASAVPWNRAVASAEPPPEPAVAAPEAHEETSTDHQARLAAIEREAFATGYAQGERAGLEAAERRADGVLRKLGDTLNELAALRGHLLQQSERQVVQLALAIARRIVHREVTLDAELAEALARIALERLGESGPATVRLHPQDFARAAARSPDGWDAAHITVVPDPGVARGGCLVESPFGFVDASIDAQFEEIARVMLEGAGGGADG